MSTTVLVVVYKECSQTSIKNEVPFLKVKMQIEVAFRYIFVIQT